MQGVDQSKNAATSVNESKGAGPRGSRAKMPTRRRSDLEDSNDAGDIEVQSWYPSFGVVNNRADCSCWRLFFAG